MIVGIEPSIRSSSGKFKAAKFSIQHLTKKWQLRQNWLQKINPSSKNYQNNNSVRPWRRRLVCFLESPQADIFVIFLLVFDLAISVIELTSSLGSPSCKSMGVKFEESWYHWVGIFILGLLFLKSMLLVVGLGGLFFMMPGYVVDGVVVGVALVLEVVLKRVGGGLMVVVSLWRVVRAVESVFELSDDAMEAKIEEIVAQFDVLKTENTRILEIINEESRVITSLGEHIDGNLTNNNSTTSSTL